MSVNLSPVGGVGQQFFDNNGVILSGGLIYTYAAGTTTPQATYTSSTGNVAHTNPIVLDSAGRIPGGEVWLTSLLVYKFILKTSVGVQIWSSDNISGINDPTNTIPIIYNTTGNGSTTIFSLLSAPVNENTTNVYINGVYQQKNTYSLSNLTLTFSEAPPTTASIEVAYY